MRLGVEQVINDCFCPGKSLTVKLLLELAHKYSMQSLTEETSCNKPNERFYHGEHNLLFAGLLS